MYFASDKKLKLSSLLKVVAVEGVNMYSGVLIPSNIYEVGGTISHKKSVVRVCVCVCVCVGHP